LLPKRKKKRRNTTERIERVCRIQWKGEEYKKGEKERESRKTKGVPKKMTSISR
jgi:hypothetical protein